MQRGGATGPAGTTRRLGQRLALSALALLLCLGALQLVLGLQAGRADEALTDPYLGQPDAIEAGKDTYRAKCYICHHSGGARGPDLFATKLSDQRFLETVMNGRKGTQMPAFGQRLTIEEVWQVHSFVKSTDHY